MEAPDLPRRRLFRASAAVGVGGLLVPGTVTLGNVTGSTVAGGAGEIGDLGHSMVLDSSGTWGDLGIYFAEQFGEFGRSTWFDADWGQIIAVRRQSGELSDAYIPHPSGWYAAVHERSWIRDRLIGVNPENRRYVVADIIDVLSSASAVVDWSTAAFAELGTPLSRGVQNVWIVRVPGQR